MFDRDNSIRHYCPACGGNFEGNAGYCECSIGKQIQSLLRRNKAMRTLLRTGAKRESLNLKRDGSCSMWWLNRATQVLKAR